MCAEETTYGLFKLFYEHRRLVAKYRHALRVQYIADIRRWKAAQLRGEDYPRPELPPMLQRENEEADEEERQHLRRLIMNSGLVLVDPFAEGERWAAFDNVGPQMPFGAGPLPYYPQAQPHPYMHPHPQPYPHQYPPPNAQPYGYMLPPYLPPQSHPYMCPRAPRRTATCTHHTGTCLLHMAPLGIRTRTCIRHRTLSIKPCVCIRLYASFRCTRNVMTNELLI
jgi:hypothetical protein